MATAMRAGQWAFRPAWPGTVMPATRGVWCGLALAAMLVAAGPPAWAGDRAGAKRAPAAVVIQSCVSQDRVSFRSGRDGVVLDVVDSAEVANAIVTRYPMIERDGLYPSAVALWRRGKGGWAYATLMAHPQSPQYACFTAQIAADTIPLTPELLKKYFGLAAAPL